MRGGREERRLVEQQRNSGNSGNGSSGSGGSSGSSEVRPSGAAAGGTWGRGRTRCRDKGAGASQKLLHMASALRSELGLPRRDEELIICVTSQAVHRVPVDGEPEIAARLAERSSKSGPTRQGRGAGSQLSLTPGQFSAAHHALAHHASAAGRRTSPSRWATRRCSSRATRGERPGAFAAAPHALETPASILELLDAIKLQQEERWKTARELATVQPLRKQYLRAARLLERFRVPLAKLPILLLTAKVFLGAVALQAIRDRLGGGLVVGAADLPAATTRARRGAPAGEPLAGRRYFPSDPSSSNSSVFDAGACYHAAADAYVPPVHARALGAAHEVYFADLDVCAVVLLASSTTAIAVENPFELAFALCIGLFFTIDVVVRIHAGRLALAVQVPPGAYQAGKSSTPTTTTRPTSGRRSSRRARTAPPSTAPSAR